MKDNASENYLDQLLNSVNGEEPNSTKASEQAPLSHEEQWERDLFGAPKSEEEVTAKNEEDFLREFEEELLKDDMMSPFSSLESANDQEVDNTINDIINHVTENAQAEDADALVDENAEFEGTLPEEEPEETQSEEEKQEQMEREAMDEAIDSFDDNLSTIPDDLQPPVDEDQLGDSQEEGELDLSGIGDNDLMDMLSDSADLSDLGDLLSSADEEKPLDGEDSIGEYAQAEMEAQEQQEEDEEEPADNKKKKGKKAKKEKKEKKDKEKSGFLEKLKRIFFGEDEDEEDASVALDAAMGEDTAGMSDENKKILQELEAAGELDNPEKKKEKKKKDKKEKKKKEPKPPKPKKEKKPKVPKEKKPKEVDNTPPLPKGPVIAIVIMIASLMGLIMLGTNLLGYQANINSAKEQLDKGSYVEAFSALQGIKIKDSDSDLYDKLEVLSTVDKKYQDYLIFSNNGNKDIALDNLVCAYGRYDLNKEKAKETDCEKEYEAIGGKIIKALLEEYDMTGDEALDIYQAKNRKEYTLKLKAKLKSLGLE